MRLLVTGLALVALTGAADAATTTSREVQTANVTIGAGLPADLTSPEGKTRWDLESIATGALTTVAISKDDEGFVELTRRTGQKAPSRVSISGADAERWLLPDHELAQMKMGSRVILNFSETRDGLVDRLTAEVATVGIGWLLLPNDPREVVLQRVLVSRQRAGERAMRSEALIHRWVSPQDGVVATISGAVSADGRTRLAVDAVTIVKSVLTSAADLKLYANQIYRGTFTDLKYGYDKRGAAENPISVQSLVPNPGIANICDLVALDTWDFSAITSGQETATTETPINTNETCNAAGCGYTVSAGGTFEPAILERLDSNLTGTKRRDNQVVQRENRATDVTIWLRAGAQIEGVPGDGSVGSGETRFCFTDTGTGDKNRNEVPIWRMSHQDAGGWYTQAGDTWSSVPVDKTCSINTSKPCATNADCLAGEGTCVNECDQSFYSCVCGNCSGTLPPQSVYARSCTDGGQKYYGTQDGKIVKGGVVKLPSGHTFNALLLRNTTEICIFPFSGCGFAATPVRTIVYIWQAPWVGSVALVRGEQNTVFSPAENPPAPAPRAETPCTNFTTVEFTDISYGLLPPVSITAGATTDTTVALSWNPGNDTHYIHGYKIYWDTDPGASTAYAFNSVANAGQVSIVGTTATISGLTPGTPYYFTVTTLSNFKDPSSLVTTQYESIRYPTTASGDPNFSYPVEVTASTTGGTCIPTQEVVGVTVAKALPNVHVCWNATADACAVGYDVLASNDATSDAGYTVVGQVGLTTCWDGNPSQKFLLIRARGTGGNGPWGHYLH